MCGRGEGGESRHEPSSREPIHRIRKISRILETNRDGETVEWKPSGDERWEGRGTQGTRSPNGNWKKPMNY